MRNEMFLGFNGKHRYFKMGLFWGVFIFIVSFFVKSFIALIIICALMGGTIGLIERKSKGE
jgi:hypothetical protein